MILVTFALCILAPCFVSAGLGAGQKRLVGEVEHYNYAIPTDLKEAMRFYPKTVVEDVRYAYVFSTFCKKYPTDEDFFYYSCVHTIRITFNEFILDTFKVEKFGVRPEAVNSVLVAMHSDPIAEVTKHVAIIRMTDGDCKMRIYVRDADRDSYETFKRSTTDCNDPEYIKYYREPPQGMKRY